MSAQREDSPQAFEQNNHPDLLIGLVGRGIQLSRTPQMHMDEGRAQGQRISYKLLDADQFPRGEKTLETIIDAAELCGFAGLNVTFPYKMEVMPLLDEISCSAQAVGAVNTVVFKDGKRIGHNTDKSGYEEAFRLNMQGVKRDHVLLIGAGGAGVAVAHALSSLQTQHLTIADTDKDRADQLRASVLAASSNIEVDAIELHNIDDLAPDGVVNATPVGMAKLPGTAYPFDLLHRDMWVSDVIYFPLETALLAAARATGCRVLPGSGMAVYQAVRAFQHFTGREPNPVRMKATFEAFNA